MKWPFARRKTVKKLEEKVAKLEARVATIHESAFEPAQAENTVLQLIELKRVAGDDPEDFARRNRLNPNLVRRLWNEVERHG